MTDLAALIPPHDPAEDAFATVGGMALDSIPLLGPLAGRALDHALATRERERRREFDVAVVAQLQSLAEGSEAVLTVADVVASDEFLAAITYTRRVAAETAEEAKRQRLALAAAQAGAWSDIAASERAGFLRLAAKYDELHIWLLAYFADPIRWLDAHGLTHVHDGITVDDRGTQLAEALGLGPEGERSADDVPDVVQDALDELATDSVLSPIVLDMARDEPFAPQLTSRGRRFLAFLRETAPEHQEPPTV